MNNRIYVTFNWSQDNTPTLVVSSEDMWTVMGAAHKVENVITGDRAITLWNELKGKSKDKEMPSVNAEHHND